MPDQLAAAAKPRCHWDAEDHAAMDEVQVGAIIRYFCVHHADEAMDVLRAFGIGFAHSRIREART